MISDLDDYDTDVLYRDWMEHSGTFVTRAQFVTELRGLERTGQLEVRFDDDEIIVLRQGEATRMRR
jgi:hypothetical protein